MPGSIEYSLRHLRKHPGFLVTAVLSLALGIGATTTVFSAFRAVFLRPPPYAEPDRLVYLTKPSAQGGTVSATIADANFLRESSHSFSAVGITGGFRSPTMTGGLEPVSAVVRVVQPDLFSILGATPVAGRIFAPRDAQDGNPKVVVLSYPMWQEQFHGDPTIINHQVMLDGESYTVIGVMPDEFQFPSRFFNMWIPDRDLHPPPTNRVEILARLRPGVSIESAQAELDRMTPALLLQYPEARRHFTLHLAPIVARTGKTYDAFLILCGAVGLLVLIACLNVANLVIARSVSREGEFAVRSALGASRGRLMVQVFGESLVLAVVGGSAGLILGWLGNRALVAWLPAQYSIEKLHGTRVDATVLLLCLGVTMLTALLCGLGPALLLSRCELRELGRAATHGVSRIRWRAGLVVAELSLSVALLVGSGLLIRSFLAMANTDPGFRPDHLLSATVPASPLVSKDKAKLTQRLTEILDGARQIPGVESAGLATAIPMGHINVSLAFILPDRPSEEIGINYRAVSWDYLATMGVPLKIGRMFTAQDNAGSPRVIIGNETFAKKYFPGKNPVGQKFLDQYGSTVVGIVGDFHGKSGGPPTEPELYGVYSQYLGPAPGATILMRTSSDPASIVATFRKTVHSLYPDQPVTDVASMDDRIADSMAEPKLYAVLLGVFAAVALALTAVGTYGTVSYAVAQRTREIGIRMALGADADDVLGEVLGRGVTLVALGVAGGLAGAWSLSRFLESLLFGVTARDAVSFAAGPVVLAVVAMLACYLPARRAAMIDPNVALRQD